MQPIIMSTSAPKESLGYTVQPPIILNNVKDVYLRQTVLTASPLELIVLLYGELKRSMLMAKKAIGKNDPLAAHTSLMKAQAIVEELVNSLDMSIPMSMDLLALYDFMLRTMEEINLKKDAALIDPVVDIIGELKDAWETISSTQHGTMALSEDE